MKIFKTKYFNLLALFSCWKPTVNGLPQNSSCFVFIRGNCSNNSYLQMQTCPTDWKRKTNIKSTLSFSLLWVFFHRANSYKYINSTRISFFLQHCYCKKPLLFFRAICWYFIPFHNIWRFFNLHLAFYQNILLELFPRLLLFTFDKRDGKLHFSLSIGWQQMESKSFWKHLTRFNNVSSWFDDVQLLWNA